MKKKKDFLNFNLSSTYWCCSEYADNGAGVQSAAPRALLFYNILGVCGGVWASPAVDPTTLVGWFINMPSHRSSHHPQTAQPSVIQDHHEKGSISEESAFPANHAGGCSEVWRELTALWPHGLGQLLFFPHFFNLKRNNRINWSWYHLIKYALFKKKFHQMKKEATLKNTTTKVPVPDLIINFAVSWWQRLY